MINCNTRAIVKVFALALLVTVLYAQPATDLERRISELENNMRRLDPGFGKTVAAEGLAGRIAALEAKMAELLAPPAPVPEPVDAPPLQRLVPTTQSSSSSRLVEEERLPVAGYMDFHFNKDRSLPGQLDFHRFVLLFGHSFSDRIKFWSELELEHAFVEGGEGKGELELEQAYLDFLIKPQFNLRAGMLLAPVGILNERHEPPSFNGVERPFVETFIIPSTWFDTGFGATGDLGRGFRYRAYLMSGLDAAEFDAEEGLRNGRQKGFQSSFRNPAKVARVEYQGIPRLTLGASGYTGSAGFNLIGINPRVDLFNFDGRYSRGRFDFRGLFAKAYITQAGALNQAVQAERGINPNVAREMFGWYAEPAVRILPRRTRQDLALFARYERFNTQHRMPEGFVPLPQFDRSAWVVGATFKPNADVALKFDYIFNRNRNSIVQPLNSVNLGIGWWF